MSFEVHTIPEFDQRAKALSKKFPSLKHDLQAFVELIAEEPRQGTSLGKSCYKVRMSIASKGRGKSGGARVITCVRIVGREVWLLTIYDKSQQDSIADKELSALVDRIP